MIPYAPDEAAPGFRSLAIATLDPPSSSVEPDGGAETLDPIEGSSRIKIPTRKRRRLRLCIRTAGKADGRALYSTLEREEEPGKTDRGPGLSQGLDRAGEEVFEEEIYQEVSLDTFDDQCQPDLDLADTAFSTSSTGSDRGQG